MRRHSHKGRGDSLQPYRLTKQSGQFRRCHRTLFGLLMALPTQRDKVAVRQSSAIRPFNRYDMMHTQPFCRNTMMYKKTAPAYVQVPLPHLISFSLPCLSVSELIGFAVTDILTAVILCRTPAFILDTLRADSVKVMYPAAGGTGFQHEVHRLSCTTRPPQKPAPVELAGTGSVLSGGRIHILHAISWYYYSTTKTDKTDNFCVAFILPPISPMIPHHGFSYAVARVVPAQFHSDFCPAPVLDKFAVNQRLYVRIGNGLDAVCQLAV